MKKRKLVFALILAFYPLSCGGKIALTERESESKSESRRISMLMVTVDFKRVILKGAFRTEPFANRQRAFRVGVDQRGELLRP